MKKKLRSYISKKDFLLITKYRNLSIDKILNNENNLYLILCHRLYSYHAFVFFFL